SAKPGFVPGLLKETVGIILPPAAAKCDGIEITVGQNERRCFKPGEGKTEYFKDCPDCPEMVGVPAGHFTMGSPASESDRSSKREEQVEVAIAKPFAVGKFSVTRGEYAAFVTAAGYRSEGCEIWTGTDHNYQAVLSWSSLDLPRLIVIQ